VEINEKEVNKLQEAQKLLKVSPSTALRLVKKGIIRSAKVGKQYRILGKELLRVLSPDLEEQVGKLYKKGRRWLHEGIDQ
jgi:excisionase family DNA binding protein